MKFHRRHSRDLTLMGLSFVAAVLGASSALAQEGQQHATDGALGVVVFPISCAPAVQAEFKRGVALLHHMMYVEARSTFQDIARTDPGCSMAHWGVAMTLFQPLWPTRPGPEELTRGWEAIQRAKERAPGNDREKGYIAAVEDFYREPESTDYWARIRRFEQGMEKLHESYGDDREAAAFYALSHLATAPQSSDRLAHHAKSAKILLNNYEAEPTHPGALHYTIHANDIEGRQRETLDVVQGYDDIAPSVPHALHMPTHIFVRLGDWGEVIRWNEKSADAALNFPAGDATSHHYPHALDYLIYAHLQRGDDNRAKEILEALDSRDNYQQTFISAYHLAAIPARYLVEQRQWAEAAAIPERTPRSFPWQLFPWPEATNQFARGLGAARSGDLAGARRAAARLATLRETAETAGEEYFAQQIEIGRMAVAAWLAHAEGKDDEALRLMRSSAALEESTEKHPVTPAAIQPAYELLGDLLLELERHTDSLDAYKASLKAWPRRFNSLLGAARAAAGAGDRVQAASYYSKLLQLASEASSDRPALGEAAAYLGAS